MTDETRAATPAPMSLPNWLNGWREWLEGDLFQEVHRLLRQREVFRSWNDIVEVAVAESRSSGLFHQWVNANYVASVALGVRRMGDPDTRTRSLVRLLSEIEAHASELTREWWSARWPAGTGAPSSEYLAAFDQLSGGLDHIDPKIVRADMDRLTDASNAVKPYVDKYIAHLDADRGEAARVTLGAIHEAVDTTYLVFHRWYQLVGSVVLTAPLVESWERIFAVAWVNSEQASDIMARRQLESDELESRIRHG